MSEQEIVDLVAKTVATSIAAAMPQPATVAVPPREPKSNLPQRTKPAAAKPERAAVPESATITINGSKYSISCDLPKRNEWKDNGRSFTAKVATVPVEVAGGTMGAYVTLWFRQAE